jgi:hypothetical protein
MQSNITLAFWVERAEAWVWEGRANGIAINNQSSYTKDNKHETLCVDVDLELVVLCASCARLLHLVPSVSSPGELCMDSIMQHWKQLAVKPYLFPSYQIAQNNAE